MLETIALWWQKRKTREKMDRVFSRGPDPFRYETDAYERGRLDAMFAAVSDRRWKRCGEFGCAEGSFTLRLAGICDEVLGVDVSPMAVERARERLAARDNVGFERADLRDWDDGGRTFDLLVFGDVLYYLDKPGAREAFERLFQRATVWLTPGGRILLAHGFAGDSERAHRASFRERFERLGLKLRSETVFGDGVSTTPVRCLLSTLDKPQ